MTSRLVSRCKRFPAELREHTRLAASALRLELMIRRRTLPELCRWAGIELSDGINGVEPDQQPSIAALREIRRVERIYRVLPLRSTCLRRSLVAGKGMRELHPHLVVGSRSANGVIAVHAWLRVDGWDLDDAAGSYVRFGSGW